MDIELSVLAAIVGSGGVGAVVRTYYKVGEINRDLQQHKKSDEGAFDDINRKLDEIQTDTFKTREHLAEISGWLKAQKK